MGITHKNRKTYKNGKTHTNKLNGNTRKNKEKYVMPPYLNSLDDNVFYTYTSTIPKQDWTPEKIKILKNTIDNKYDIYNKILLKGTKVYCTTLESDPFKFSFSKNDIYFFGLDVLIAIWYGLEMWQRFVHDRHTKSYDSWIVYLHEYEIIHSLKYEYLPTLSDNPIDEPHSPRCKTKPCVHPQMIFHGNYGGIYELGTELTIPKSFKISEILKHKRTHKINLIKLLELQNTLTIAVEDIIM